MEIKKGDLFKLTRHHEHYHRLKDIIFKVRYVDKDSFCADLKIEHIIKLVREEVKELRLDHWQSRDGNLNNVPHEIYESFPVDSGIEFLPKGKMTKDIYGK